MIRSGTLRLLIVAAALAGALATQFPAPSPERNDAPAATERFVSTSALPPEAVETLQRIQRGGPFPYRKDGSVFQNREGLLPERPRGHYREYTVDTPGSPDRGARRIVTGGNPPETYYYTADHYRSFRRIEAAR